MNFPAEMHRLTGRMRKARRRGRPHDLRAALWFFSCATLWLLDGLLQPSPWSPMLVVLATIGWLYGQRAERRSRLYQRVVDRCQGAILSILAMRPASLEEAFVRGRAERAGADKTRWS